MEHMRSPDDKTGMYQQGHTKLSYKLLLMVNKTAGKINTHSLHPLLLMDNRSNSIYDSKLKTRDDSFIANSLNSFGTAQPGIKGFISAPAWADLSWP